MTPSLYVDPTNWPDTDDQLSYLISATGAKLLSQKCLPLPEGSWVLAQTTSGLAIQRSGGQELPVMVDFIGGSANHRRKFGGGKSQAIAKAVGLNKGVKPSVLDVTGGLGRDAFVLSCLGCVVTVIERSPIISALLKDGVRRAQCHQEIADYVSQMTLIEGDSVEQMQQLLASGPRFQVVYLDPMFPHRQKSAQVKKEMRLFQALIGADLDADQLLTPALALASHRVVIKRPKGASDLGAKEPTYRLEGKSCRYDIHVLSRF